MKYDIYKRKLSKEKIDEMPDYKVEKYFSSLVELLPNNGRLYKYRSFDNSDFDKYLNAIKGKYLWLPKASKMDDKFDSRINTKIEEDFEEIKEFIRQNPYLSFIALYKESNYHNKMNISKKKIDEFIKHINPETGKVNETSLAIALKKYNNSNIVDIKKMILDIEEKSNEFVNDNIDDFKKILINIYDFSDNVRDNMYIFSMCERFDNNFLWDIYGKGDGFCIEYDFKKALKESIDVKRKLLLTLKVNYYDELKRFSLFNIFEQKIKGSLNKSFNNKESELLLEQMISKDKSYLSEEEWRIIQYKTCNITKVDLISSIIIDEKGISLDKSKELLKIANKNNINVLVRKFSKLKNEHIYMEYNY